MRPNLRWSRAAAAVWLTTITLGLAACGGASDGAAGDGQSGPLTVWMKKQLVPSQNEAIEKRVADFSAETGIPVSVETIAYEDFLPKWSAALESGDVPDVSFLGYQEVGQFFGQEALDDVSDLVAGIEKANGPISDTLKKPVTFDGAVYGVPFWAETQVLYYRTDLFQQAGIATAPATWDEFRQVARQLTGGTTYGAGIGFGDGNSDAEFFSRAVAWSYGGSLDAAPEDAASVQAANEQAVQFVKDVMATDRSAPPDAVGWDDSGNNRSYLGSQSAMVFNTGSLLNTLKSESPDIYAATGVAPYPAGPAGAVSPGIENNLGIFADADNKDGARKLISYLLDKKWYQSWTDAGAPLNIPVYDDLRRQGVWKEQRNAAFATAVDGFQYLGHPSAYSPAAGEIYNLRLVNKMFGDVIVNNTPVPDALSTMRGEVDETYEDLAR
jgi:multiple sugar transport system substrate-binding protein